MTDIRFILFTAFQLPFIQSVRPHSKQTIDLIRENAGFDE